MPQTWTSILQFASPGTYGLDELWDGTQLKWQCADLHAGVSRHTPLLYELESPDPQASNYWALANRMVGEVNYVQLFHWIQNQSTLWQEGISIVFVYVDNRPLSDPSQCPNFWGLFCPWLLARCSYLGPFQEITTAIHVPIDASSGLDKVHFTWAGTFVLEALVYLFPDKHIILIDTDCVPTSLFEVEELVRMTQTHLDQAAGVEPNTIRGNRKPACKSAVFLCSEAKAEINAGVIIITNCRLQRPHAATESAAGVAKGLLGSRQGCFHFVAHGSFQGTSFNSAVCNLHLARAVEPGNGRLDLEPSELTAQTREAYQTPSQTEPQIQISCHHHGPAARW